MKISYNWLKSYLNINMPAEKVGEILTEIGLELEGIETYVSIPGGLEGLVIGEVVACEKHPNANKLSLTKVNVGKAELLQIVCGAPNVAAGQKVVVAQVGTTIYPITGDPIKMKKAKIRGFSSQGMICAEDEVGLGTNHNGIMVLPKDTPIGTPAANHFNIERDQIFEIGLTPNRSDATSHIGVAEDLAAALKINYDYQDGVQKPSVADFKTGDTGLDIEVIVENTTACPRYSGVCINNITIKESPDWLKQRLTAIGVRPISNVVDITNFVLHELGQPLHAFDYQEIAGKKIIVKNLAKGSKFISLDEVERSLHEEDLMICDGNEKGMCIGGVFGGIKSGVKDHTTAIFLESAHFHPTSIRRTSMRHLLRTDAAKCFEKGADPNNTVYALKRAALLMQELTGGEIVSEIIDIYPNPIKRNQITFTYANVNRMIGVDISKAEVKAIFEALNIQWIKETDLGGTVSIPTNKFDVTREADLIEEILRIYGFNKVEFSNTIKSAIVFGGYPNPYAVRNTIADFLASTGYNEMMGMSIVQTSYPQDLLPFEEEKLVYINNTSNQNLDLMRPTMLYNGLETIRHNQNHQQRNLKLFEFGNTYTKKGDGFKESAHLVIYLTGQAYRESWLNKDKNEVSFYNLKTTVNNILKRLGIKSHQTSHLKEDDIFAYGLKYHRGKQILVTFGRVHTALARKMDIKQHVFYADFNWDNIFKALKNAKVIFEDLSKYPAIRRDLALVIEKNINFNDIVSIAMKNAKKILTDINLFDVYENEERLGKNKKSYAVSYIFQDAAKTLKDKEVERVMKKLINAYERQLGAVIRK